MLEAGLTCRQWFDALCHKKFMSRIQIQFEKLQLSDIRSPPLNVFKESMRLYSNIRLNQVDLDGNSLCFWQRFGACLNHVEFNACDMHERTFSAILLAMNNLESIAILNCRDLFLTGHLFKNPEDQVAIRATCKNLKSLSLSNNRYISDAIFHRMGEMQSIQDLNLSGCLISFHTGLYRKFYPKSQQEPSENVFTFFVIMQFIEKHAKTLKFLDFSETLIDSNAMNRLAEVEHLQLHGLKLRSCDQLTNNAISKIVNSHKTITEIDLSLSVRFTDVSLLNALSNLKVLKMRRCRAITDQNIHQIHQLKHLEHLDLSQCDGITSKGFIEGSKIESFVLIHLIALISCDVLFFLKGIASQTNDTMVELYLSALNICELAVIKLAETMKNLRLLDLSFCKNAVTNLAVQIIFKHLKMLRTLNLEFCDMVSVVENGIEYSFFHFTFFHSFDFRYPTQASLAWEWSRKLSNMSKVSFHEKMMMVNRTSVIQKQNHKSMYVLTNQIEMPTAFHYAVRRRKKLLMNQNEKCSYLICVNNWLTTGNRIAVDIRLVI